MNIKNLRLKNNLTQAELAKQLGVDQTAVSQWETGATRPKTGLLPKLAELLDCPIDALFGTEQAATSLKRKEETA